MAAPKRRSGAILKWRDYCRRSVILDVRQAETAFTMADETISQDEYDIFTAIFHGDRYRFDLPTTTVADETSTHHFTTCADWIYAPLRFRYMHRRNPDLTADFETKNRCKWKLERRFDVPNGFQFLSERQAIKNDEGNFFTVSRVGFDRENAHGLVYFCYYGGPLCAQAYFLLMEREGNSWREMDAMLAWLS